MRTLDPRRAARILAAAALALAASLALSACGSQQSDGSAAGGSGGGATAKATTQLTIEVKSSRDAEPESFTLTCGDQGAGGNHPNPAKACKALDEAKQPFAPVPENAMCTQIFGGDQTATITGTWKGQEVDASYSRKNGCEIDRWNTITEVFPVKTGA